MPGVIALGFPICEYHQGDEWLLMDHGGCLYAFPNG
jgi:hypothetical protein